MRVRMITSMGGDHYDLPYGTELAVGEALAPERRQLDHATAMRWLEHAVVERVSVIDAAVLDSTFDQPTEPEAQVPRRQGRRKL